MPRQIGRITLVGLLAVLLELVLGNLILRASQGEVDLKRRVVRSPMRRRLDQAGPQCVLQPLPVLEWDVAHGFGSIEVLGQGHRDAGCAQLGDKAGEEVEHGDDLLNQSVSSTPASSLAGRSISLWYLSRILRVSR